MKLYLISNNLLVDGLSYNNNSNLEQIRMVRPLSFMGEKIAEQISENKEFLSATKIYSSFYASAISCAKYLSVKLEVPINIDERLNDCKVGTLGNKNMKMVKGLQDHDFTYKLPMGESLNDVGNRLNNYILSVSHENENCILYTHKRAIVGFLLKYCTIGYNLDDNLILEYNSKLVYDDTDTDFDIYEIIINNKEVVEINKK